MTVYLKVDFKIALSANVVGKRIRPLRFLYYNSDRLCVKCNNDNIIQTSLQFAAASFPICTGLKRYSEIR